MGKRTCSIEECDRDAAARGWCRPHWKRWHRHGDPLGGGAARHRGRICSVAGCENKHDARGYCTSHYNRVSRDSATPVDSPLRPYMPTAGECRIDTCDREVFSRRMCWGHYYRDWRYGDPGTDLPIYMDTDGPCLIEGCEKPRHGKGYCSLHHQRLLKGVLDIRTVSCVQCGADIDLWETEGQGRRKRPVHISRCDSCLRPANPITAEKLHERDGDACGICGEAVDMSLRYPDPLSPSVDHVIPLAAGGPNTPANCALAHLAHNIQKRARVGFSMIA